VTSLDMIKISIYRKLELSLNETHNIDNNSQKPPDLFHNYQG